DEGGGGGHRGPFGRSGGGTVWRRRRSTFAMFRGRLRPGALAGAAGNGGSRSPAEGDDGGSTASCPPRARNPTEPGHVSRRLPAGPRPRVSIQCVSVIPDQGVSCGAQPDDRITATAGLSDARRPNERLIRVQ